MNILAIRTELEDERTWRRDEIRFLLNRLSDIESDDDRDRYRRAVVLLLYAHFEGFCKTALLTYVRAVNDTSLNCAAVQPAIAAATCSKILRALADSNAKSDFFRRQAPNDDKLHFAWRSQNFFARIAEVMHSPVLVPDDVVDTESNLWPVVLKKNLFRLGLDHNRFEAHEATINQLVQRRNDISHGAGRAGISAPDFEKLQRAVYEIIDEVMVMVVDAVSNQTYRLPIHSQISDGEPNLGTIGPT